MILARKLQTDVDIVAILNLEISTLSKKKNALIIFVRSLIQEDGFGKEIKKQ